ncbi:DsbA family protein [Hyphomicrobium sp.]|uniref:DsbA family protein n=1 Tax=Hyphomicrobium sp. TaxID=82 RepID=UPI0025BF71B5|nr:DsbA family protein [Hyphomicrobium sp.]MCC7253235.1 DsbA family protein [Hyphomicrobium sp.]
MHVTSRLDRRQAMMAGAALAGLGLSGFALPAYAQRNKGPAEVPVDDLMKTGDLADLVLGPENAKVTIVEYASMTCGHCKHFHDATFPELKKKYIDTGKIRFVFREFPLDARAFAASMLARCAGSTEKSLALVDALFDTQDQWAFVKENPTPKLFEIAKQAGFTQESFDKCLTDQKLLDQITASHTRAAETFGVNATPSFFINGKRLQGSPVIEEFDKMIEPLLAQG